MQGLILMTLPVYVVCTMQYSTRAEYDEWESLLMRHLGTNKTLFHFLPEIMKVRKPKMPIARPEDTVSDQVKSEYRHYFAKYDKWLITSMRGDI